MQEPKTWACAYALSELRQLVEYDLGLRPTRSDIIQYTRVVGITALQLERFLEEGVAKVGTPQALACAVGRSFGVVIHGELIIPVPGRLIHETMPASPQIPNLMQPVS